jgi:hypothetical protein
VASALLSLACYTYPIVSARRLALPGKGLPKEPDKLVAWGVAFQGLLLAAREPRYTRSIRNSESRSMSSGLGRSKFSGWSPGTTM